MSVPVKGLWENLAFCAGVICGPVPSAQRAAGETGPRRQVIAFRPLRDVRPAFDGVAQRRVDVRQNRVDVHHVAVDVAESSGRVHRALVDVPGTLVDVHQSFGGVHQSLVDLPAGRWVVAKIDVTP